MMNYLCPDPATANIIPYDEDTKKHRDRLYIVYQLQYGYVIAKGLTMGIFGAVM